MSQETILLVDDSRFARQAARNLVAKARPGAVFLEAADGEAALASVATQVPDLVLMDLNMPGRDGLETAAELRKSHPGLAICLVTANIQDAVRDRARALGIAFLGKPMTPEGFADMMAGLGK